MSLTLRWISGVLHVVRVDDAMGAPDDHKPDFLVTVLADTVYKLYNSDGSDEANLGPGNGSHAARAAKQSIAYRCICRT